MQLAPPDELEEAEEEDMAEDEDVPVAAPEPGWLEVGVLEEPVLLEPQPAQRAPAAAASPTRAWRRVAPPQPTVSEGVGWASMVTVRIQGGEEPLER